MRRPVASAGSNHAGGSDTPMAHVTWPAGASAGAGGAAAMTATSSATSATETGPREYFMEASSQRPVRLRYVSEGSTATDRATRPIRQWITTTGIISTMRARQAMPTTVRPDDIGDRSSRGGL